MRDLVAAAIEMIERTIDILRANSCDAWAGRLEELLTVVETPDRYCRKEALLEVGQVCHPKVLGDAHVRTMEWSAWIAHLGELHDSCARAFNQLEG